MKLPEHERQAHKDAFRAMSLGQKLEYILAYYKLPIVLVLVAAVGLGSVLYHVLMDKQAALYVGCVNVATTPELDEALTSDFLDEQGIDDRAFEVVTYQDLYLSVAESSADQKYSYASRLKILAAIDAEQLDVVLMNRDAYDLLSHSGYLLDLGTCAELPAEFAPLLATNDVVLEDNEVEVELGEAEAYEAVTERATNALCLSGATVFSAYADDVYLGIVANTPRLDAALAYAAFLAQDQRS